MIYTPSEDSFLLSEVLKDKVKGKTVLDMGSGSGIQAQTAMKSGAKAILSAEIDEESLNNLKSKGLNAVKSDLFSNINGKFDVIVFNPPYLPRDKREDVESARATTGGKQGDEIILRFLRQSTSYLNKNGFILLLLSSLTPSKRILKLLKELNLKKEVVAKKDLFMESLEVWLVRYI